MNRALAQFARLLQPLNRRILDVVARAVVKRLDDSKRMQLAQLGILDGETRDAVERFQNYGFTSVPLEGAEAVVLSVGGHRDHCLVVAVDDRRHRLRDLEPGEVAVFHKDGARVHLKADGSLEVHSKTGESVVLKDGAAVVTADTVKLGGDTAAKALALAESVQTQLSSLGSAVNALGSHVHTGGILAGGKTGPSSPADAWLWTWTPGDVGSAVVKTTS